MIKRFRYETTPKLPVIGRVKIGELDYSNPKQSAKGKIWYPPRALDYFRFVANAKDADGRYLPDEKLNAVLGKTAEIEIWLDSPEQIGIDEKTGRPIWNFPFWKTEHFYWGMTNIGLAPGSDSRLNIICRGDGIDAQRLQQDGTYAKIACDPTTCPYSISDTPKCKPNGQLAFMIKAARVTGGVYLFETTSRTSINHITTELEWFADRLRGLFRYMPFKLILHKEKTIRPDGKKMTVLRVILVGPGAEEIENYMSRAIEAKGQPKTLLMPPEHGIATDIPGGLDVAQAIAESGEEDNEPHDGMILPDENGGSDLGKFEPFGSATVQAPATYAAPAVEQSYEETHKFLSDGVKANLQPAVAPVPVTDDIFHRFSDDPGEEALAENVERLVSTLADLNSTTFISELKKSTARADGSGGVNDLKKLFVTTDCQHHEMMMRRLKRAEEVLNLALDAANKKKGV